VRRSGTTTYLLHDAGLSLGEGNVTTRLVLDELDLDLSSLAARLVVVVVIVVGGRSVGGALSLDASLFRGNAVVVGRWRVAILWICDLVCHCGYRVVGTGEDACSNMD
jgi:hypothetical protein